MSVGLYSRRSVCTAGPDDTIRTAAERMDKEGVGTLVVVDGGYPIGVLTDRDAALCAQESASVTQAMSAPAVAVRSDARVADAAALMGRRGVRRVAVVGGDRRLCGLLAADDILRLVASELAGLAAVAAAQIPAEPEPEPEAAAGGERVVASHYAGEVVQVRADAPVAAAIAAMREHAVGCVAVTSEAGEPVGLLSDRDIAVRVVARGADRATTPVSRVMSSPAVSCDASAPLEEIVDSMRLHGVRRVLITREGRLTGIVTFDDLIAAFGDELHGIAEAVRRQVRREQRRVQAEHVRDEVVEKLQDAGARLRQAGGEAMTALGREVDALREKVRRWRE
jgi:CBS domain-containing protein